MMYFTAMAVFARSSWLSLTPEPERELPAAMATLRTRGIPSGEQVAAERDRAERLVIRGTRRQWMRWLAEAEGLAERAADEEAEAVVSAREMVLGVVVNHHALMLGLPGRLPLPSRIPERAWARS
jgi:hypothetical protein